MAEILVALNPTVGGWRVWNLEEKHDVEIDAVFDGSSFRIQARLREFLILSWNRGASAQPQIREVDRERGQDLPAAVMKAPGPFFAHPSRGWPKQMLGMDPAPYLRALQGVRMFEVAGGVDFDEAAEFCLGLLSSKAWRRA